MNDTVKCIDISHWQGLPDFAQVKASGVIAMIHKATEGTGYIDKNRARNCANAIKEGIKVCTYHWIKPGSNAKKQMEFYLKVVNPVQGERMVIDYEEPGCTLDQLKVAVQTLLDDPRNLQVTIYSGHLLKEQLRGKHDAFLADNTDLWLAQYTTGTPTWPTGTYPIWTLWQFSENGQVPGIPGLKVDLNRFNGSDENLLKWISPAEQPVSKPEPEEEPAPKPDEPEPITGYVEVSIATSKGIEVSIVINGDRVEITDG